MAHEVGTVRMMRDGVGAVDKNIGVIGIDNLYVCGLCSPSARRQT